MSMVKKQSLKDKLVSVRDSIVYDRVHIKYILGNQLDTDKEAANYFNELGKNKMVLDEIIKEL